jgi:aminocarboxymuconate-semialdehyde decarboxylase
VIIDAHAHTIVPEITRAAAPQETWRPIVRWQDGKQIIEIADKQIRSAVREIVDIEQLLEEQNRCGVDRVVLSPWVSLLRYDAEPEDGLRSSRIYNQALSGLTRRFPDRVSALGTIPMQDPALAASELKSLVSETGIGGVIVAASVRGVYLGDPRFEPVWQAAEEVGALVFIHPTTRGFDLPVMQEYYLWNTVGNPLETAVTAAHMVMAGVMQEHPGLKVLLAHGGGALLILRGRLARAHGFQPMARAKLNESPGESLKRFYYDSLVHDPGVLGDLIEAVGVEHVLLGSDYPFDMGSDRPRQIVESLGLNDREKSDILGGNAARLLQQEG